MQPLCGVRFVSVLGEPTKKDFAKNDVSPYGERVDDIGLETIGGTTVQETTCEESLVDQKPFAPKVAPIAFDSDLQAIIDEWPRLSDSQRQYIVKVIDATN
jgi:hypothetical protein